MQVRPIIKQVLNGFENLIRPPQLAHAATATAVVAQGAAVGKGGAAASPLTLVPFTRASREHTEPAFDTTLTAAQLVAGPTTLGPFDVPAFGFARGITLLVEAAGGTAAAAVKTADGPWAIISSIAITDVNGANIVGPFTGFDLMLANKWGGYTYDGDPLRSPAFVAITALGNFTWLLHIPFEAVARDAIGSLANMNAASTYKIQLTAADDSAIYSVVPDTTFPAVRFRGYLDAWSQPNETDPSGNPQATRPPMLGTTQFWSKASYTIANGANTIRLSRVGNFIRTLVFIFRDATAAREGASVPDPVQLHLDGRIIQSEAMLVRRSKMAERYGYELAPVTTADDDEGVWVYDYSHDFDGKPGGELRDLWLPTVQSSRLELVGSFGEVGSLDVLTNDVAPVGNFV